MAGFNSTPSLKAVVRSICIDSRKTILAAVCTVKHGNPVPSDVHVGGKAAESANNAGENTQSSEDEQQRDQAGKVDEANPTSAQTAPQRIAALAIKTGATAGQPRTKSAWPAPPARRHVIPSSDAQSQCRCGSLSPRPEKWLADRSKAPGELSSDRLLLSNHARLPLRRPGAMVDLSISCILSLALHASAYRPRALAVKGL